MKFTKEMLETDRKTMTVKQIAQKYNISESTVGYHLKKFGLTKAVDRTDIVDSDIINDYNNGLTIMEIAKKYNASHETITKRLKKYGISNNRVDGIKRHFKRTFDERWSEIESDLNNGYGKTYLRNKYKIRMDNLENLMKQNGYYYSTDAYEKRILQKINEFKTKAESNKRYRYILGYMESLLAYYRTYREIPTRKDFATYIGIAYSNVCITVKNNNISSFFRFQSVSKYEALVEDALKELKIEYIKHDRKILGGKELDFYLVDFNVGLEVNPCGRHCVEKGVGKLYHQEKSLLAQERGIGLINLYDYDLNKDGLNAILKWITNTFKYKIGARKCVVKGVSQEKANEFFDQYHSQGKFGQKCINFGLFYDDILVNCISFKKHRYSNQYDFEIIRYATHYDYCVHGGFDKLIKNAKIFGVSGLISTYVDLDKRKRSDNIYALNGFNYVKTTSPGYFWSNGCDKVYSRYMTQKSKLIKQGYDRNKTENEIMHDRGFYQVFTAGNLVYELEIK